MIVCSSAGLSDSRNSFLNAVGSAVQLTSEQTSSHENVAERLVDLKVGVCYYTCLWLSYTGILAI